MHSFKIYTINGMDEKLINADGIKLITSDGQIFELWPRRSDGEVHLSAKRRLIIKPIAVNAIQIIDSK